MAGGFVGTLKKAAIDAVIDKPAHVYIGGAVFLWTMRKIQTQQTYNLYFGKCDFQRRQLQSSQKETNSLQPHH
jgi:hypothetical protein